MSAVLTLAGALPAMGSPVLSSIAALPLSFATLSLPPQGVTHFEAGNVERIECLDAGTVTTLVEGDFARDHHPDVLALADSTVYFLFGVDRYESCVKVGLPANDVAKMEGRQFSRPDTWLTVGDTGLEHFHLDYDESPPVQRQNIAGGDWIDAKRIGTFARTSFNPVVAWGLAADGETILIQGDLLSDSGLPPGMTIDLNAPVLEMLSMNWSGDGQDELVVVTNAGFHVFGQAGVELLHIVQPIMRADMEAFEQSGFPFERLALRAELPGLGSYLFTMDSVIITEAGLALTGLEYDVVTGDINNDGDGDVVLLSRATTGHAVLLNQLDTGASSTFGVASFQLANLGVGTPNGEASTGLLFDVGADGDNDLVYYSQADTDLIMAGNALIDSTSQRPGTKLTLSNSLITYDDDWAGVWGLVDCLEEEFCHRAVLDFPVQEPVSPLAGATHLQFEQWLQEDEDGLWPVGANMFLKSIPAAGWGTLNFELPLWEWFIHPGCINYVVVRMVRLDVNGAIEEVGPSSVFGVTVNPNLFQVLDDFATSVSPGPEPAVNSIDVIYSNLPFLVALDFVIGGIAGDTFVSPFPSIHTGGSSSGEGGGDIPDLPPSDAEDEDDDTPPTPPRVTAP